jgi:hypothetical protein
MINTHTWTQLSTFCTHLSPVIGPLIESIGHTARAIEKAHTESKALKSSPLYIDVHHT